VDVVTFVRIMDPGAMWAAGVVLIQASISTS
jgi:hypothetical protein